MAVAERPVALPQKWESPHVPYVPCNRVFQLHFEAVVPDLSQGHVAGTHRAEWKARLRYPDFRVCHLRTLRDEGSQIPVAAYIASRRVVALDGFVAFAG